MMSSLLLKGKTLKLIDLFTYLGNNISSNEINVNIRIRKALIAIDRLKTCMEIWSLWPNETSFFQAVAMSVLLYGCTTWIWWKLWRKKNKLELDKDATDCFEQNPGSNIPQNNRCTATYLQSCKSSKKNMLGSSWELKSNVFLWIPIHGYTSVD